MELKIAVIGLGYVGLPLALAFQKAVPGTIGFDIDPNKITQLKAGKDPTREGLENEIKSSGLTYTSTLEDLKGRNFFIVGVPTPVDENKQPDLSPLRAASRMVGSVLSKGAVVVFESTVYPGVTEEICGPILEEVSGLKCGVDFKLGYSPERINPGDKEHTLTNVTKVIAGQDEQTLERIASAYGAVIKAGLHRAPSIKVAEAAKVIENTQRDLNIALMNELAIIFDRMNLRTKDVLDAAGTKWNFLKFSPGLVGGHCIGVDPYYLTMKAQHLGYHPQVILAGRQINDDMGKFIAQRTVKLLINAGVQPKGAAVGVFGITFKENVTDIRNSRVPDIVKELMEFGVECVIHDPGADDDGVKHEYGLSLTPWEKIPALDAAILAVGHRQYLGDMRPVLFDRVRKNGVVVDVKSAIAADSLRDDLTYWSL